MTGKWGGGGISKKLRARGVNQVTDNSECSLRHFG